MAWYAPQKGAGKGGSWAPQSQGLRVPAFAAGGARPPMARPATAAGMIAAQSLKTGLRPPVAAKPEKETLLVTSQLPQSEVVVRTVVGTYVQVGENHGKHTYKKQEKVAGFPDLEVWMYYWDTRDGNDFSGWWCGDQVGGAQVFARCKSAGGQQPPQKGWNVPWDAPTLRPGALNVVPKQSGPASAFAANRAATPGQAAVPAAGAAAAAAQANADFESTIAAQKQQVQAAVDIANSAIALAQANSGATSEQALFELEQAQQTLKDVNQGLQEHAAAAKAKAATGAVLQFTKLVQQLKVKDSAMSAEVNKVKAQMVRAEAQKKAEAGKAAKKAEEEAKAQADADEKVPAAQQAFSDAEVALENVSQLADSLKEGGGEDTNFEEAIKEVETGVADCNTKIVAAGRAVNLAIQAVRKAGAAIEDSKTILEDLNNLKMQLDALAKKLAPLKKAKLEIQTAMKGKMELQKLEKMALDFEMKVEKLTSLVDDKKASASKEDVVAAESSLRETQPEAAALARLLTEKLALAKEDRKEQLTKLQARVEETATLLQTHETTIAGMRASLKVSEMTSVSKTKAATAKELVQKYVEADAVFSGATALEGDDKTKAVKASEKAMLAADRAIALARGWIKQKLVDCKKIPEETVKPVRSELETLQTQVEKDADKLIECAKKAFPKKYPEDLAALLTTLRGAEEKVETLRTKAKGLCADTANVASMLQSAKQASAAEKEAVAAVADVRKRIDAKAFAKGAPAAAGAVFLLQGRLRVIAQQLAELRKVAGQGEKLAQTKKTVEEEESGATQIEEDVEKLEAIAKKAADEEMSDEAALELDKSIESALTNIKNMAKTVTECQKADLPPFADALKKLLERSQKAQKAIEEVQAKTKDQRERALCGTYVVEMEKRVDAMETALETMGDAELPFLSGLEVLPVAEATETLAKCAQAETEASQSIVKAKTYMAKKVLELGHQKTEAAKTAGTSISAFSERIKGAAEKLERFKSDIAEHRRKADLNEAQESMAVALQAVKNAVDAVTALEGNEAESQEEADKEAANSLESLEEASEMVDNVRRLVDKRSMDRKKQEGEQEALNELVNQINAAYSDLSAASRVAEDFKGKFLAASLVAEAEGKLTEATEAHEAALAALAPLLTEGGAAFLVDAAVQVLVQALQCHMAAKGMTVKELFKHISGGGERINEKQMVEYLTKLPAELAKEELDFEEDRRHAIYQSMAEPEGVPLSEEKFIDLFKRQYKVIKNIALTSEFSLADSKTVKKLEVGALLLALGDAKKDEGNGLTRVQCELVGKGTVGWVTHQGNQGSSYLEPMSKLTDYMQEMDKVIKDTAKVTFACAQWMQSKFTELMTSQATPFKEARADLMKKRSKANDLTNKTNALKQQMLAAEKEYQKKEQEERNAHVLKKEREAADAVVAPAREKVEDATAKLPALEGAITELTVTKPSERKNFATPLTLQTQCEELEKPLTEAVDAALEAIKAQLEEANKQAKENGGAMSSAKKILTELKATVSATVGKRDAVMKMITTVCKTASEAVRAKITAAWREEMNNLGLDPEAYFKKVSKGGDALTEEVVVAHVGAMSDVKVEAEHMKLFCKGFQGGTIPKRKFVEMLQVYYTVVKDIAVTPNFEIGDHKPLRKALAGEFVELLEGPRKHEETGVNRLRGRLMKDGIEGWVAIDGNKGSIFLAEAPKPYYACSKELRFDKDEHGKEDPIRSLLAGEILELLEGPRRLNKALEDKQVAKVKACKDEAKGFVTIRDQFGTVFAEAAENCYVCASITGLTDNFDMNSCKVLRKLALGETLLGLGEPKDDPETGMKRVNCRALKDNIEGWVAIAGAKSGTAFLKPATKMYKITKEVPITNQQGGKGEIRALEVDELIEISVGPRAEKVDVPTRIKARVFGDGVEGWVAGESTAGLKLCRPLYQCSKATPLHEVLELSEDAKVVRQLAVGELLEPLGVVKAVGEDSKVLRVNCRSEKDGAIGWATLKDKATTFLSAASAAGATASSSSTASVSTSEWSDRVAEESEQVDFLIKGGKAAIEASKQREGKSLEELLAPLQQAQEEAKETLGALLAVVAEAKAAGAPAQAAYATLSKLPMRLKGLQVSMTAEMGKVKKALAKSENKEAAAEAKGKADGGAATGDAADKGEAAAQALEKAEESVEALSVLFDSLSGDDLEASSGAEAAAETEQAAKDAHNNVVHAGRSINLALQAVRKAGSAAAAGALEDCTAMKTRQDATAEKLKELKKQKTELQAKLRAKTS
eukprot:TRINITY_DN4634_c0_g1_i1.p1 TRINITY_DN4634_c0_g1~~TRINITY_DN4634_c0_g1_i1.p1  ORF type:complete len:2259 (-),score=988.25 TRINITY_DN4634_c0_g1_i1:139-6915(-)